MVLRSLSIALLFAAAPVAAQVLPAQAPTRAAVPGYAVGWFGFRQVVERDSLVVLEVAPDSPAQRAGLRKGDRITMIDGRVATSASLTSNPPAIGDIRRMTVRRGGEMLTLAMVAVEAPRVDLVPSRKAATEASAVAQEARVLRGQLALKATRAPAMTATGDSLRDTKPTQGGRPTGKRLIIVDGVLMSDSLYASAKANAVLADEMYAVLKNMTETRDASAKIAASPELYDKLDRTLREFDVALRSARSNAIAGAEFEQLNPGLADYFNGISEGVFVLRLDGATPAALAGLRAGDIVQSVNGQRVFTIPELRDTIAEASGTITLGIVRKGKPETMTLRKE